MALFEVVRLRELGVRPRASLVAVLDSPVPTRDAKEGMLRAFDGFGKWVVDAIEWAERVAAHACVDECCGVHHKDLLPWRVDRLGGGARRAALNNAAMVFNHLSDAVTGYSNGEEGDPFKAAFFHNCGGTRKLVELLQCTVPEAWRRPGDGSDIALRALDIDVISSESEFDGFGPFWMTVIHLLRNLAGASEVVRKALLADTVFIEFVFSLLFIRHCVDSTLLLLEEIFSGKSCFDLSRIEFLDDVVEMMPASDLTLLSRILSALVQESEPIQDPSLEKNSLELLKMRRRSTDEDSIANRNSRFLAQKPQLTARLVHCLRRECPCIPSPSTDLSRTLHSFHALTRRRSFSESNPFFDKVRELFSMIWNTAIQQRNGTARLRSLYSLVDKSPLRYDFARCSRDWEWMLEKVDALRLNEVLEKLFSSPKEGADSNVNGMTKEEAEETVRFLTSHMQQQEVPSHLPRLEHRYVPVWCENLGLGSEDWFRIVDFCSSLEGATLHLMNVEEDFVARESSHIHFVEEDDMAHISQLIELLFVLSVLAGSGKEARRVHIENMVSAGLVNVLHGLFDRISWAQSGDEASHLRLHGEGCECNPISAVKIQYLRLVHNFCCRDAKQGGMKRLLLSPTEILACRKICHLPPQSQVLNPVDAGKDDPGLLHKLVNLLFQIEDADSQSLFWVASTLEAFLRGGSSEEQILVTSWGMVELLILKMISDEQPKTADMLQTNFDLLGEIFKLNPVVFEYVERKFTEKQLEKLMRVAMMHLIDSNVFFRCLFLSMRRFEEEGTDFQRFTFARILHRHRISVLRSLMTVVKLDTISQESICCLNTALLQLLMAHEHDELSVYLQAVEELGSSHESQMLVWVGNSENSLENPQVEILPDAGELGTASSGKSFPHQGAPALLNYRELLWFWHQYYLYFCPSDRESLASSSGIPFEKWLSIADLLCQDDGSFCSLLAKGQTFNSPSPLNVLR